MSDGEFIRYRFGPRERGRTLAGWRAGQILTVGLGLLVGVGALRAEPSALGVGLALVILALCGGLATWPIGGRTAEEWFPVVVCWGARRVSLRGARGTDCLAGLELLAAGHRGLGVVHDRRERTLTAAVTVRGQSFALLGAAEQDRRVGSWSAVLAAAAREGSPVRRLQWMATTVPDRRRQGPEDGLMMSDAPAASVAVSSYRSLLADVDASTCSHEVVMALQVRAGRSVTQGCEVLEREVLSLSRLLSDADLHVESVLSSDDLASLVSRTFEEQVAEAVVTDPWPMAVEEQWGLVRVDGLFHVTYWVSDWPRTEIRSDFLAPLLLNSARATVSVVMEPLGPEEAARKVEASRTADLADAELRRRGGFMSTARRSSESEVLARREAELVEGHASFRFAGFVTVSAATVDELERACDLIVHAAGQSRLGLRRLYGDQTAAYTCSLPFARGLR
jgi:hypothetical protein